MSRWEESWQGIRDLRRKAQCRARIWQPRLISMADHGPMRVQGCVLLVKAAANDCWASYLCDEIAGMQGIVYF